MSALPQSVGDGSEGATLPRSARAQITIRGLSKAFGGAALYRDFDLDIARRSVVSIFGPNGWASRR
jgi:ABC-type transporter Mla maintaining outer membrane lipid asymmetry ATPase subunit MlaF